MMNNVLGYFLCAVIAAGSFASGPILVYRDCCEKSFVFNQLDIKGCTGTQEDYSLKRECCAPLMSHTLGLTAEPTQVPSAKQHATVDVQCALPDILSTRYLEIVEYSLRYETSPPTTRLLVYQRFSRLLI